MRHVRKLPRMPIDPSDLPDDIEALKALVLAQRESIVLMERALAVRSMEIEQLNLQISKLRRMQFGQKSEKLDRQIEQLETRLEDLLAEEGAAETEVDPQATPSVRKKAVRKPLPEHLEREERILEPETEACPECGGKLKPLGEDISEQLDIISNSFRVIRQVRRKKACACCDCIVQAAAPSRPMSAALPRRDCTLTYWLPNTLIINRLDSVKQDGRSSDNHFGRLAGMIVGEC
ncbi:transposase (plasmid) [Cupriavidus taiwanensis]|nr:transposase [Cupriavidus taiwanensis]